MWLTLEIAGCIGLVVEAGYVAIGIYASLVTKHDLPPAFWISLKDPFMVSLAALATGYLGQIKDQTSKK